MYAPPAGELTRLVFHACNPYKDMGLVNGTWVNKRFGTKPSLLHFNGGGKHHRNVQPNGLGNRV